MAPLCDSRPALPSPGLALAASRVVRRPNGRPIFRLAGLAALLWLLAWGMTAPARASVRQLAASTAQYTSAGINQFGSVVWQGGKGTDGAIFLWDGSMVRKLTGPLPRSVYPTLNNAGQVAWSDIDDQRGDVFLWDGSQIRQITHGGQNVWTALNDHGQIAWMGRTSPQEPYHIYLWTGTEILRLTPGDQVGAEPRINNHGQVVWEDGFSQVYLWDGSSVRALTPAGSHYSPQINNAGHVVWLSDVKTNYIPYSATQVFLWDGTAVRKLGDGIELLAPGMNDHDQVLWWDIFDPKLNLELWDGSGMRQLPYVLSPRSGGGLAASINNLGQVVWQSWDGSHWQIYLWKDGTIQPITTDPQDHYWPQLNDAGQMVWLAGEEGGVYLYDPNES